MMLILISHWLLFFQKLAGNNELLDLGCAFIDTQSAHVAIKTLHHCRHESSATMNFDGLINDSAGSFSGIELSLAGSRLARPVLVS